MAKLTSLERRLVCGICTESLVVRIEAKDEEPGPVLRARMDDAIAGNALDLGWKDFRTFQLCPEHAKRSMSDDDYFLCEQRALARSKALNRGLDFMIFGGEVHSATGVRRASVEELQLWERLSNIHSR